MKDATTITIDRETYNRIKELASDTPIARYLRKLTVELSTKPCTMYSVEKRLDTIENLLRGNLDALESSARPKLVFSEDGKIDLPKCSRGMPMMVQYAIAEAIKENPAIDRFGWNFKNDAGEWVEDVEAMQAWQKEDDARKDREFAEREKKRRKSSD